MTVYELKKIGKIERKRGVVGKERKEGHLDPFIYLHTPRKLYLFFIRRIPESKMNIYMIHLFSLVSLGRFLMCAELDACDPDDESLYIELKTTAVISSQKAAQVFERC